MGSSLRITKVWSRWRYHTFFFLKTRTQGKHKGGGKKKKKKQEQCLLQGNLFMHDLKLEQSFTSFCLVFLCFIFHALCSTCSVYSLRL